MEKQVVYYLNNQDCSGVFSTFEKAKSSLANCASRCSWVLVSEQQLDYTCWNWRFVKVLHGEEMEIEANIFSYNLDEDNSY